MSRSEGDRGWGGGGGGGGGEVNAWMNVDEAGTSVW